MTSKDKLGDRMKRYEDTASLDRMTPGLPVIMRLDGKAFHTFTKGLKRPYDENLSQLMIDTTKFLVQKTNACIGYTQSDEITLIWQADNVSSQIYFDGRRDKLNSVLASYCSVYFNEYLPSFLPEKYLFISMEEFGFPVFDARTWCVPSQIEACNALLWREQDATRNSIQMAGQYHFSHKQLQGLSTKKLQEKLWQEKRVNWNDYPSFFKRGTYIQRKTTLHKFTADEIDLLPPKHEGRTNPDLMVERREYRKIDMPPFHKVINKVEVVFNGEEPKSYEQF